MRSKVFSALILCGLLSVLLDIVSALIEPASRFFPIWSVYAVNILFLCSLQFTALLFLEYTLIISGVYLWMKAWLRHCALIPFLAAVLLIALSPVMGEHGIFYLDAQGGYFHGELHILIYISVVIYLLSGIAVVLLRRKSISGEKIAVVFSFLAAAFAAILIQLSSPSLLVNTTATAFVIILIYHLLEAPGTHMDALTKVLNRTAMPELIKDLYEENQRCTLMIFALHSFHLVNQSIGTKNGDAALMAYADYLKQKYSRCYVIRSEGDMFTVVRTGGRPVAEAELKDIYDGLRQIFSIGSMEVRLSVSLAGINSEDCESAEELMSLVDCVTKLHREDELKKVLMADADFRAARRRITDIEQATENAIAEDRVEVYFQPIFGRDGRMTALEALLRIFDPKLGMLPTQELVELAEKNGTISALGERILRRTCAFIRDNGVSEWGLDHIGVNLSAVQCIRDDLYDEIMSVTAEYGVSPSLLSFEITETAAASLSQVRQNMERITREGFSFLLDDFGKGYANFRNLAQLPYYCIKIDKLLLWDAQKEPEKMRLLTGVVGIIKRLGLKSLCEGVETKRQELLLIGLGVDMLQGYLYSKPLSPEKLIEFAGEAAK